MNDSIETMDWNDIAKRARMELSKRLPSIQYMDTCDLGRFIEALREAEQFEMDCAAREERAKSQKDFLDKSWEE